LFIISIAPIINNNPLKGEKTQRERNRGLDFRKVQEKHQTKKLEILENGRTNPRYFYVGVR